MQVNIPKMEFVGLHENADEVRGMIRDRLKRELNFHHLIVHRYRHNINCKLSGAVYAATEITGAIPLIHGLAGCAFHHRLTPHRMEAPIKDMPCTDTDECDVIYGGEAKLHRKIIETYQRYHPELIAVLQTCVSGIIGDDVRGVVQEVDVPCAVIQVPSDGFAMDRWSSDISGKDYVSAIEAKARGCGFMAVMNSLVDQLMEEQDVVDYSVNLEASNGYGRGLDEITKIFDMIGVRINTTFLSCTVDAIRRAPAAELNIVGWRGTIWAEQMKKRFGTDYIRGSSSYSTYSALEATERFLSDVAAKFDLDGIAEEVIQKAKSCATAEVERYARIFKDHDFALFPSGFLFNPYSVKTYVSDLRIPLKYVCIDTRRMNLPAMTITGDTIKQMIGSMETVLEELDSSAEIIVNPELSTIARDVDYIIGDRNRISNYWDYDVHIIDIPLGMLYRTGFNGLVEFAAYLTREIGKPHNSVRRRAIISRLDYDEVAYPMLADNPMSLASREMWSLMWSLRSG